MRELRATPTHRRIPSLVLSAATLIAATLLCVAFAAAQELVNVRISVDYRLYGSNAPLWYAQDSGLFRAAGINAIVDASSGSGEAINRVASGAYDAAYADVGTLAEFWSRNPKVAPKLVMVIHDRSAQSIVSLKKANITKIGDLVGHKVGTGQADATSRLFPAILKVNDIATDKINLMPVEQRIRDALLLRGDVDAVIGFDSTILFNLMTQKVRPEDTNVIYFADTGFNFYGNGLVVSRAFIESNPEAVKRLTSAVAKAWVASIRNPQATIDALAKRDSLTDVALEVQRLQWILDKNVMTDATRAGGIGVMDPQKMQAGLKTLAEGFNLPTVPTIEDLYDGRFLPPAADRAIPTK
ncbi:MAG: NitT/TauT family transport system substrate-binding protein [Gammaproteobacteria bacterium]|nr:NitT/TauT family transport system substrate-binding protein [Gammaproteobacteria bacterium]